MCWCFKGVICWKWTKFDLAEWLMHPLFSPFPRAEDGCLRASLSHYWHLLVLCVRNEPGNNAFYLYLLVSMTCIDFFLLRHLTFQYFTSTCIKPCYVWITSTLKVPDYPWVEICLLEELIEKSWGIRWETRSRHRLGHVPNGVYTAWFVRGGQRALCWLHARSAGGVTDYHRVAIPLTSLKWLGERTVSFEREKNAIVHFICFKKILDPLLTSCRNHQFFIAISNNSNKNMVVMFPLFHTNIRSKKYFCYFSFLLPVDKCHNCRNFWTTCGWSVERSPFSATNNMHKSVYYCFATCTDRVLIRHAHCFILPYSGSKTYCFSSPFASICLSHSQFVLQSFAI